MGLATTRAPDGDFRPSTGLSKLDGRRWSILMRPARIEIATVLVEYKLQMSLVQDEDVIQAFTADRPIARSQCALALGANFGARMTRMPAP